jgi:hypothetical protein
VDLAVLADPASSPADPGRSTPHAPPQAGSRRKAARPVREGGQALAHGRGLEELDRALVAHDPEQAARRRPEKHRARSAQAHVVVAAESSNIPRLRKAR